MNSNIIWFAIVSTIVLLSGVTGITLYQDIFADKQEKVTICHKPNTSAEKTMQVTPKSLPSHLGHGDIEVSCDSPPLDSTLIECNCRDGPASACFSNSVALCDEPNSQLAYCNNIACKDLGGNAGTPTCTIGACQLP